MPRKVVGEGLGSVFLLLYFDGGEFSFVPFASLLVLPMLTYHICGANKINNESKNQKFPTFSNMQYTFKYCMEGICDSAES